LTLLTYLFSLAVVGLLVSSCSNPSFFYCIFLPFIIIFSLFISIYHCFLFYFLSIFITMYWLYRGFQWDISIYAYTVPRIGSSIPMVIFPHLPPPHPYLEMIATDFIALFSYKYIMYIDHIHPPFTFPLTIPFLLVSIS
jgi:hypothetical protein